MHSPVLSLSWLEVVYPGSAVLLLGLRPPVLLQESVRLEESFWCPLHPELH